MKSSFRRTGIFSFHVILSKAPLIGKDIQGNLCDKLLVEAGEGGEKQEAVLELLEALGGLCGQDVAKLQRVSAKQK